MVAPLVKVLFSDLLLKVAVLRPEFSAWNYSVVGELLAPRMWQACVVSTIDGEVMQLVLNNFELRLTISSIQVRFINFSNKNLTLTIVL